MTRLLDPPPSGTVELTGWLRTGEVSLGGTGNFDVAVAHHATYYNPLPDVPVLTSPTSSPSSSTTAAPGAKSLGIGIAAVVLKYRLPGSMRGSSQGDLHEVADRIHVALEDAEAAMRLMREGFPSQEA